MPVQSMFAHPIRATCKPGQRRGTVELGKSGQHHLTLGQEAKRGSETLFPKVRSIQHVNGGLGQGLGEEEPTRPSEDPFLAAF
jgi:hypothetical protein